MMKESRGVAVMLGWHALAIALLLLLPGIKAHSPLWLRDPSEIHAAFLMAGAYLVAVLILGVVRLVSGRPAGLFLSICVTLAAVGVVCLDFLLTKTTPFGSR